MEKILRKASKEAALEKTDNLNLLLKDTMKFLDPQISIVSQRVGRRNMLKAKCVTENHRNFLKYSWFTKSLKNEQGRKFNQRFLNAIKQGADKKGIAFLRQKEYYKSALESTLKKR